VPTRSDAPLCNKARRWEDIGRSRATPRFGEDKKIVMNQSVLRSATAAFAVCLIAPDTLYATNGYAPLGWGTQSKAMGGVATALPQDTLVTATNPAGMAFIGTRLDVGVSFFSPSDRGYEANADYSVDPETGNATGPFVTPGRYESDRDWFLIPSFGYNRELDERSSIGFAVYGNGGMNTTYRDRAVWENFAVSDSLSATTPTGINLEQLFFELPYSYKFGNGRQAVGIAPIFALQSFEAKGLEPFKATSLYPDKVTNNGEEWSYGFGLHLGWYGEINEKLALGLSYRSKTWMTDLDDYKGLFANGGEFDIPATLNFGVAYKVRPDVTLAFDYQHIFYDEIDAIANSNDKDLTPCFTESPKPSYCLGGEDGLGFGWDSMDIFKLGVRYDYNEKLSFMGGVSYNTEFSEGRQALFNVLAPATIRWHFTLGATYNHSSTDAFNIALAYMPTEELDGTSPSITQTQTGSIFMEQQEIEVSWSHRF